MRYTGAMRLWIDAREACRERKTGKGQWTLRCVGALLERGDVRVTVVTDVPVPPEWNALPGFDAARVIEKKGFAWHFAAARILRKERDAIDAYVSPTSFIVPCIVGRSVRTVPVVHDMIAFRNEPHDRKAQFIERVTLPRALRTAHAVCCVSDATADALRERFPVPSPLVTVGAGPTVDGRDTWTGTGDHILCVATLCPRKNQESLIRAYASLPAEIRGVTRLLLVGGRGWQDGGIVALASSTPGVTWMGFQSSEACTWLLRTCRASAFVSTEEGFGLPVLDALRVGAPTLVSDIPSLREVAGDAAAYCDPFSVPSIAVGLRRVLAADDASRAARIARSDLFSWEETVGSVLSACAR